MSSSFKPEGYNSVSPYFITEGAQKLLDLLKQIFDAEELRRYEREDGSIMHAELKIDDSVLMFTDATIEYPAIKQMIHVYVKDVDTIFKKAVEAGCKVVNEPQQKGDPDKRGTFLDFAGNMWSVATQIRD